MKRYSKEFKEEVGTSKSFVYDPGLRSRRNIRITEMAT